MLKFRAKIKLVWLWAILVTFTLLANASAQEENGTDSPDTGMTISGQQTQEKKANPLNYAIIGVSFGGMFLVSSIHWLSNKRGTIESEIFNLNNFISNTNSVNLVLQISDDVEPMLEGIDQIQNDMDDELHVVRKNDENLLKRIADVENLLLRRVG